VVALSSLLLANSDPEWHERGVFDDAYDRLRLDGSPSAVDLMEQVDQGCAEFATILKLSTPT